jgi:MFS family permease
LARFTPAFLILKAHNIGVDAAFVPIMLILMHLVYAAAAYPFGMLADRIDRRLQLMAGAAVLIVADVLLASATTVWLVAVGAGVWGLQMAVTQGLLAASVADAAPVTLRGTAFGIYDLATGAATFIASFAAGALWAVSGPKWTFACSGMVAAIAILLLLLQPAPRPVNDCSAPRARGRDNA